MKKIITSLLICIFINSTAFGADEIFTINPNTIRSQLFTKNISLREALNNVENSKLNVSVARAKLLPSLNLSILLPALANPTFLLSSVTFLFPFLVPSNWAVLKQQKELFESDKASYKALQLNILSNSLSLYYTFLSDKKVQNIYQDQSELLQRLYTNLKKQSDVLGNVTNEDLNMALATWEESKMRVSKLEELLLAERAGLRTMLGLPLGASITIEEAEVTPSEFELKSAFELAEHALDVAPESMQLGFLIKAAKSGKFSKLFGFISSASLGGSASNSESAFNLLKASGAFNFGAENLVNLKIADNNIQAILLRADQLKLESEKTAEIVSGSLIEVKEQLSIAQSAEQARMNVFNGQKRQYQLGLISLQNLLLSQSQLTDTKINNLKAHLDLNMQRLTLLRLVVGGDFSLVKGCTATTQPEKRGIFNRKKEQSLDQICQL